jgi:hypothetical protein
VNEPGVRRSLRGAIDLPPGFVVFIRLETRSRAVEQKKVIAVLGATGAQGGGLVRAITSDPKGGFAARAVVRDPNSEKAKALEKLGAEIVQGDVDDGASLRRAFQGAYGAYCVTFFWAHYSPEKEMAEAALTNAAKGAKHDLVGSDTRVGPWRRPDADDHGNTKCPGGRKRTRSPAGRRPTSSSSIGTT